ncbi:MAG: hypothetical protein Q8Q12_10690 [bacterium]|nr:hypothetical protein [bacterium]
MNNSENTCREEQQAQAMGQGARCLLWHRLSSVIVVWLLLLGLLVGARYYTLELPIVHDEGVFLYGGMAWAAGELPYRDFWDHKPPGITLFHALPIRVFGCSVLAVRLHEIFWLAVAATLFAYLCHSHLALGPTILGVLFYAFFVSVRLIIRSGGLTEESALTFYALSYLFALRQRGHVGLNFFLAGLFLGLAAQFRQPFGVSIVFIALCVLWRPQGFKVSFGIKVGVLLLTGLGALLPEAVCSGYFFLKGMWWEYFEASYFFNFVYTEGALDPDVIGPGLLAPLYVVGYLISFVLPPGVRTGLDLESLGITTVFEKHEQILKATGPYLLSPLLALPMLTWLPPKLRRIGVLMIVAFLCDFVAVSLGGRYYQHYYLQMTISSSFLLALIFQAIYEGLRPRTLRGVAEHLVGAFRRCSVLRGFSALLCVLAGGIALRICIVSTTDAAKRFVREYKGGLEIGQHPSAELSTERSLGDGIKSITLPDERILLLGASPTSVYFASQRLAGARYYHLSPFFRQAFAESIREVHRERFLADLKERKPVLLIVSREERQFYFAGMEVVKNSAASFLLPYLEENYVPLEDFYPRSKIRRSLGWTWYGRMCSFLIRKDMTDEVRRRIEHGEAASSS